MKADIRDGADRANYFSMLAYSERKESFSMSAPSRYSDLRYMACNPDATASMCRETGGGSSGRLRPQGDQVAAPSGTGSVLRSEATTSAGANVG